MQTTISIIVAVARNGVIGRDGDMPWKLSTDLKRFKALTMGKPMIMGRKTFASLGAKPLPGRQHIVVSRSFASEHPDVHVAGGLVEAIDAAKTIARAAGAGEVCIVGGGEIYRQALACADILHVTHVDAEVEGDTLFAPIDPALFEQVEETFVPAGERDNYSTRYAIYRRRAR